MSTAVPLPAYRLPGRLTAEDRAEIAQAYRAGHSPTDIGRAIGRDPCTIACMLKNMGIYRKKRQNFKAKPATQAQEHLARETSPITLVGFTDPARIMEFKRRFGADRIRVAPASPGKIYGEAHHA